ncbi:PAS domain-containing protein [Meiothermus ruber]|uniref:histidine kinase n=1 Tax=Meiothermus ruber (strain ATCC 35948 / DSM 1279 / VKM B-1258 / 21) TaxID=504728 RepID=D3PRD8_MEIRD|nr:PAS domain-containing protein [Meiothermus ruber]ADD28021.1 PAS/PAC sensor signal transduction histidine kinase [Meiothermus ruber DSM 1279]AGK04491.1 PAS/PAC sensor signal transduction histidine kinase [Meiothermus ruber DSM 1279]MCL6531337.1 PAS domain-containing protein [Meiothermus ruber]GAO74967.1 PAS/PAC sensor signal transduction histidine kinase [Meiothermus ruber H328]
MRDEIFRIAVETILAGVVITDAQLPDYPIVYCNPGFVQLTGYPSEEVLGRNCRFLQGPATNPETVARLRRAIHEGRPAHVLLLNYRKDGQPFWNDLRIAPVRDVEGRLTHFVGIQSDVSAKVEGVRLLEQALEEWRSTVDTLPEMVFMTDEAGRVRRCNLAAAEFFGLSFHTIIGQPLASLLGQKEELFRGAGGEFRLGRSSYVVLNYPIPRRPHEWVHVVRDITAHKEIASQMEWLLTAVKQAAEAMVLTDPSGLIESLNNAFQAKTGWQEEEALGKDIFTLQAIPPEVASEIRQTLGAGRVWSGSYQACRRTGEVYLAEATISPVRDLKGRIVKLVHIQRDVTERRRLEAIAETINMTEQIGYVFAGLRHELVNPIGSAMMALSALRENVALWPLEKVVEYVERALAELDRAGYLLRTLKTFSLEELELAPLELGAFLRQFVKLIQEDFEQRGISLSLAPTQEKVMALADPRALYQVLLNLLSNAADALEGQPLREISLRLERQIQTVELVITDTGRGMGPDEMARLFRPFYTTKPQGSGLGLVIAQRLMAGMRGTITIKSERGRGTEVTLTLEGA